MEQKQLIASNWKLRRVTFYFQCAVEEVVEIHLLVALCTYTGFAGTRVIGFCTAQNIMKAMTCVSSEHMSIFKTSFFPVLVDHCGGVKEFYINISGRVALICQKFGVALRFRQVVFEAQVVDEQPTVGQLVNIPRLVEFRQAERYLCQLKPLALTTKTGTSSTSF